MVNIPLLKDQDKDVINNCFGFHLTQRSFSLAKKLSDFVNYLTNKKSSKDTFIDCGTGFQVLKSSEQPPRTGVVQPEEEEAPRTPYYDLSICKRDL